MIIGIYIKNYKTFGTLQGISLSDGTRFSALIGGNGTGKSTVLESLDCFFNQTEWNMNLQRQKVGDTQGFVVPLFLIPRKLISDKLLSGLALEMNDVLMKRKSEPVLNQVVRLSSDIKMDDYYLLSVGVDQKGDVSLGPLAAYFVLKKERFLPMLQFLRQMFIYLLIPTDVTPNHFEIISQILAARNWNTVGPNTMNNELPFEVLSSGEKQQRLLSFVEDTVRANLKHCSNLILSFDEPETSLQESLRYDQFASLYQLSGKCNHLFVASHWYGFIPIIPDGYLIYFSYLQNLHRQLYFDIARYREDIKIRRRLYWRRYHELLPVDVMLKSQNDFIQSILEGVTLEKPYSWLICEGSSEQIYFDYYFEDLIQTRQLRIAPIGGAHEVKKAYSYLSVAFPDLRDYIKGMVVLLLDTDAQLLEFPTSTIQNLYIYRLVNHHETTELVPISANPKSPKTEIEDVLNGYVFYEVLKSFKKEYPKELSFVDLNETKSEIASYYALNLSLRDNEQLTAFFDAHHSNKFRFAERYVAMCKDGNYLVPNWILTIRNLFIEHFES